MPNHAERGAPAGRPQGALAVGAGILASRLVGLLRASVTGAVFGVGPHADVFSTALRAPNLLQNLLGEQALSASFIPVYSRLLAAGRTEAARRFAGAAFGLLLALVALLSLLGVLAARPLVALFAVGYLGDGAAVAAGALEVDRFELAVVAVRWIFPMTGLLVLSAWALGVLNSHGRFLLSYLAPVAWNAAILGALVWGIWSGVGSGPDGQERLLIAACVGALIGGLLQFLVQVPGVWRALGGLQVAWSTSIDGVRDALRAFWPALAGRGVVQFSSYLDQVFASLLAVGAVSALGYAQLLYLLPVSLFGQSVAAAALPALARAAGTAPAEEVAARTRQALGAAGFLNLPTAIAYVALGPVIVGAIYGMLPGRFGAEETWLVGLVLAGYALGLPASTASRVLQSAFFALGDTRTPARAAAARVAVGAAVAVPAMLILDARALGDVPGLAALGGGLRLGALGLALGASVAAWIEWAWLGRALAPRLPGFAWRSVEVARTLVAGLAAGAAGLAILALARSWGSPQLVAAMAAGAAFAVVYLGAAQALGLPQAAALRARLGGWARR